MAGMSDSDIGVITPDKQAALALIKDRGAPMTTDNLARALTIVARGKNSNDLRPSGIEEFNLEAPTQPRVSQGSGRVPQGKPSAPARGASGAAPNTEPPSGTIPSANPSTSGGGVGDILPWLLPILGLTSTKQPGANPGSAVGNMFGGGGNVPQVTGTSPTPQARNIPITDQTTRVVDVNMPKGLPAPDAQPQVGFDSTPRPQARTQPIADPGATPPPAAVGGPQPMSMFSDAYTPEAGDELARSLMLAAESRGLAPEHIQALKALANIVTGGPSDSALDESRPAIEALQSMPYTRQQQVMGKMKGNPILSQDFNAYLNPRINRAGDALKSTLRRAPRG